MSYLWQILGLLKNDECQLSSGIDVLADRLGYSFDSRSSMRSLLYTLEDVDASLDFIQFFIGERINASRARLNDLQNSPPTPTNIFSLPNEILSYIFTDAFDSAEAQRNGRTGLFCTGWITSISISHTCKRFRNVALRIPKMWTSLSNLQSTRVVEEMIRRSSGSPLSISVSCVSKKRHIPKFLTEVDGIRLHEHTVTFLDSVMEHSSIWSSFSLIAVAGAEQMLERVSMSTYETCFPMLSSLRVELKGIRSVFNCVDFFDDWEVPNVSSLRVRGYPPDFVNFTSLRSLNIEIAPDVGQEMDQVNFDGLLDDLSRLAVLEQLAISINFDSLFIRRAHDHPPASVVLSNLRHFCVHGLFADSDEDEFGDMHANALSSFIAALSMPNLEELEASFNFSLFESSMDLMRVILPKGEMRSKLSTFKLVLGVAAEVEDIICHVLTATNTLRHISMECDYPHKPLKLSSADLSSSLETLRFKKCSFDGRFIDDCVRRLAGLQLFKKLEMEKCSGLSRHEVERFLPREKISWIK